MTLPAPPDPSPARRLASLLTVWLLLAATTSIAELRAQDPIRSRAKVANRLLLSDGRLLNGQLLSLDAETVTLRLDRADSQDSATEVVTAPMEQLLAVHGPAAEPAGEVCAVLVGGEKLRGTVVGGDELGDTFVLRSTILGERRIPLDRLELLIFGSGDGSPAIEDDTGRYVLPEGADEVLFVPAASGFDRLVGEIHRFTRRSIRFRADGEDEPSGRLFRDLAAFGLRGGFDREAPAAFWLTTRAGDRIGVDEPELLDGRLSVTLEDGDRLLIDWSDVTALSSKSERRTSLVDCELLRLEQTSFFSDSTAPLYPLRRDRAVDGSLMAVAGLGAGSGLGVHSRTVFEVVVPEGRAALVGAVGIDDSARELAVRACVDIRIERGEEPIFAVEAMRTGRLKSFGRLAVRAGETLRFVVDFGPGLDLGDRVDWIDVAFVE